MGFKAMTRKILIGLGIGGLFAATQALAMPEEFPVIEPLGVELKTGAYTLSVTDMSIGPAGSGGLAFTRHYNSNELGGSAIGWGWSHSFEVRGLLQPQGNAVIFKAIFGKAVDTFTRTSVGSFYDSEKEDGAGLLSVAHGGGRNGILEFFDYYAPNGDVIHFQPVGGAAVCAVCAGSNSCHYEVGSIEKADGERLHYDYKTFSSLNRLESVNSSLGWNVSFKYDSSHRMISVQMVNLAEDYCAPSAGGRPALLRSSELAVGHLHR